MTLCLIFILFLSSPNANANKHIVTDSKLKTGLLHDDQWAYRDGVSWISPKLTEVPETFDLRDLMKNGQPEIKSQNCGDCWAWATHHGLEIARAVHEEKAFDLSVQSVLSCSNSGSCRGGYMSAVNFLIHGLTMESDFPYVGRDAKCKFSKNQIEAGWDGKVIAVPYIGNSLRFSRAKRNTEGVFEESTKISEMTSAMYQWKGPLVVTVAAYKLNGPGIFNHCSAINSQGDHMVNVVGWDHLNGKRAAHVWNSWGLTHGDMGVSRIQWECGAGNLNRGLGTYARIVQYKSSCMPPDAGQIGMYEIKKGSAVEIGAKQEVGTTCSWVPTEDLDNPNSCVTKAHPTTSTEYHLTATNDCGTSSSMTLIDVWGRDGKATGTIQTPFGSIPRNH